MIKVGVPSLVTLNVQSKQLDVGREMPIFPSVPEARIENLNFPFILAFIGSLTNSWVPSG